MLGLPFTPLSGIVEPSEADIQMQTLDRNVRPGGDPRPVGWGERPWIEPNWDAGRVSPAQSQGSSDPFEVLKFQSKTDLDHTLGQIASHRTALQKTIDPDIDVAYQSYGLDFQRLDSSNLDPAQKEERKKDLATAYLKKKLGIQAGIRNDLETLDTAEQKAKSDSALKFAMAQHDIQNYQEMVDRGELDPAVGRSRQFKAAGKDIPAEAFRPRLTPMQELANTQKQLAAYDRQALNYRTPATTSGFGWHGRFTTSGKMQIAKPEAEWTGLSSSGGKFPQKEDYRDLTDAEKQYYETRFIPEYEALKRREQDLLTRLGAKDTSTRLTSMARSANTPSPFAQNVRPSATLGSETRVVGNQKFRKVGPDSWEAVE